MRKLKSVLVGLWLVLLVALGSGLAFVTGAGSDEDDRGVLATLISKALSSPGMSVSIGAVDGPLSADATIRDIVIADANGPWLKLDRARIVWTRTALLSGRLLVDRLEIGRLDILRRPLPSGEAATDGPLLPELPVKVEIGAFTLADLALGPDVAGAAAHLAAEGRAKLGKPSEGLDARFDLRRLDSPGTIGLTLAYVPSTLALRFRLAAEEPQGGIIARLAKIPDLPGVHLDLSGDGTLDALDATLALAAGPQLTASGSATLKRAGPARQLILNASGRFAGLMPADLRPVFGGDTRLAGRIALADDGAMTVDGLSLAGAGARLEAKGRLTAKDMLDGRVDLTVDDLARFGPLAGRDLRGGLALAADVSGSPGQDRIDARVKLVAERLQTGVPALDGLIGGRFDLSGAAGLRPGGGLTFSGIEAGGRHVSLTAKGEASKDAANIDVALSIPDVARASTQLAGRGEARLHVTGSLGQPDLAVTARLTEGRAMGRPVPSLGLTATVRDAFGPLKASARIDGAIGTARATGDLALSRTEAGAWAVKTQGLALGSARINVDVTLDANGRARGQAHLDVPDLDQLSPLVLQKLAGTLRADIALSVSGDRQGATVAAHAARLRLPGAALDAAHLQARVADLRGAPAVDGTLEVTRLSTAGESVERLKIVSVATPGGSDLTLTTALRGMALDAAGRLATGGRTTFALNRLNARRGTQRIALAGPASIEVAGGRTTVRGLALDAGGGRLSLDGSLGSSLDLRLAARRLPLSLSDLFQPALGLAGTIDAQATITGSAAAPAGDWQVKVARLQAAALRGAGAPPIDVSASGRLAAGQTSVQAALALGKAGQATFEGRVPIDGSARLDLAVKGQLDAALANAALAADGRTLTGRVSLDARATGDLANPRLSGAATLSNGSFEDPLNGLKLTRIEARLRGQGEDVTIEQASAVARNGGPLAVTGRIRMAPAAGFPADLHLTARDAELVSNPIVTAVASLALDLSGPLAQRPRVTGRASIREMDVTIPQRMPFSNRPLAGAKHVKPTAAARQRLAMDKARAARQARGPAFEADLDLVVSAPSRIYVRGRGMDAELGGELRLTGTLGRPVAIGAFDLRRGKLEIAGQRLDFSRGKVDFAGDVTPNLDFVAETTASDVTAQVSVSGPASKPVFGFSSSPSLPQDEVISRLLFARASGSLSPVQALQLAQTVAELTGDGGPGSLDRIRRSLGVDSLDLRVDAAGKPTVGASRYITRNTRVGVRTGTKPEDSAVTLGVDLTRRLRAQGEVGADGKAAVGVGFEWEY